MVEDSAMLLLLDAEVVEDVSDTGDALLLLSVGGTMTLLEDEPTEDEEESVLMLLLKIEGSAVDEIAELEELMMSVTIELDVNEPVDDAVTTVELVDDVTAMTVEVAGIEAVPWKQEQALRTLMGAKELTKLGSTTLPSAPANNSGQKLIAWVLKTSRARRTSSSKHCVGRVVTGAVTVLAKQEQALVTLGLAN